MSLEPEQFEYPQLKAAVRRAWGDEQAPVMLRARIEKEMTREGRSSARWQKNLLYGLAVAAMVLVGIGVGAWVWPDRAERGGGEYAAAVLPERLATAMVATHDACCSGSIDHHHLAVARDDFEAIGRELSRELRRPVLAANVEGEGWAFRGAAVCRVGGVPAGHLIFQRGQQTLSIFSLPSSVCGARCEGKNYDMDWEKHAIAGFEKNGGVYCLVAYGEKMTTRELNRSREAMKGKVVMVSQRNRGAKPQAAGLSGEAHWIDYSRDAH